MTFRRLIPFIAAVVAAAALALIVNALYFNQGGPKSTVIGVPSIGGPFELVDHQGRAARDGDYRGKYLLVMFGYTFCPDVCPTELQLITEALELLGPAAAKIQPLMITLDPERDTAAVLADFIGNFHPSFIGLTGSLDQIKAAAKAYRVFFAKGEVDKTGGYDVDHSAFIYLMGPDGVYLRHFGHAAAPEDMAARILAAIAKS
jgi:protein SCO1/2